MTEIKLETLADLAVARRGGFDEAKRLAAKAVHSRCAHDLGFDRELGPLGCNLGDQCFCAGAVLAIRDIEDDLS